MKKTKTFNVGDKVFAKVKGYPAWPAKIVGMNGGKFEVNFYGTGETGLIKVVNLFYYLKHKEQFCRNLKRKDYIEAIEEIEEEIRESGTDGNTGEDNDAGNEESQSKPEKTRGRKRKRSESHNDSKKPTQNDTTVTEESEISVMETNTAETTLDLDKTTPLINKENKAKRLSLDSPEEPKQSSMKRRKSTPEGNALSEDSKKPSNFETILEIKDKSPSKEQEKDTEKTDDKSNEEEKPPTTTPDSLKSHMATTKEEDVKEKEDEVGDKKELSNEVENAIPDLDNDSEPAEPIEVNVIQPKYLQTVIAYGEHVKENSKRYKSMPVEDRENSDNQVLLATLPSGKVVGIKYATSPSSSEYDKALSEAEEAKTLLSLKDLVEKGDCKPEDDPNMFITHFKIPEGQLTNPTPAVEHIKTKLGLLKCENSLVEYDTKIKNSLGLDKAEPKTALKYLDLMANLAVTAFMLKKHPFIVDMVKRLKRYVGNFQEWNLAGETLEEFQSDAEKIRAKAEEIFDKFKSLFSVTDNASFFEVFNAAVEKFKEDTKHLKEIEIFALCAEPFSRQAFFDNHDLEIEIGSSDTETTSPVK